MGDRAIRIARLYRRVVGPPAVDVPADLTLLQSLIAVGVTFVLAFCAGLSWASMRDDPETPLLQTGLVIGSFYAVLVGGCIAWTKIYRRFRPDGPSSPPDGPQTGWAQTVRVVTPRRVAVAVMGVLALLPLLLLALLPYRAVDDQGSEQRCGSALFEANPSGDRGFQSEAPIASDRDTVLQGNAACVAEAKHRLRLLAALAAATLVAVTVAWMLVGGSKVDRQGLR